MNVYWFCNSLFNPVYVIIGNGVAGVNAACAIREKTKKAKITMISRETEYFYSRTALMYIAMGDMRLEDTEPYERDFYRLKGIDIINSSVNELDSAGKFVVLADQKKIHYDTLLLATGAIVSAHGWPGLDLDGVVGFISYQDLGQIMRLVKTAKQAVVVGGGLIGVELCEVFKHFGMDVTFLIREPTYWAKALSKEEGLYVQAVMTAHGINVITGEELKAINGVNGSVKSITTKSGTLISCEIVGIATGVTPEVSLARNGGVPCGKGILTDWFLKSRMPDVFAAGDCVEVLDENGNFTRTIWYSARDMGRVAGQNMCGDSVMYDPGEWYNSARFFDKEYTVAGRFGKLLENETEYLYQDKHHSVRIILSDKADRNVSGFSMIGSRWDHEKLLAFIREQRDLDYFLRNYKEAQFDPEFHNLRIARD